MVRFAKFRMTYFQFPPHQRGRVRVGGHSYRPDCKILKQVQDDILSVPSPPSRGRVRVGGHSIRHDCKTLKQVQGDILSVPSPPSRGRVRVGGHSIRHDCKPLKQVQGDKKTHFTHFPHSKTFLVSYRHSILVTSIYKEI